MRDITHSDSRPRTVSRIRRNVAALLASQLATLLLSMLTVALVPKYLGPAPYGAFSAAGAYIAFFALASTLGSGTFLLKTISREPSELGHLTFNALLMKIGLGGVLVGVAVVGAIVLNYPGQTRTLIEVASAGILLFALTDILAAGLQATGRISRFALWGAVQRYIAGAVGLALLVTGHGVVIYTLVLTASLLVPLLTYGRHLWPDIRAGRRLDFRLWKVIASGGLPFFFWSAVLLVYGSIDILMLQRLTDSDTVGWYNLAYSWIGIPVLLPSILVTALFPSLSATATTDHGAFNRTANKALKLAIFVGTPMAVGISLTASDIIRLFHYPASYAHAIPLMRILCLHIPIVAMDMILAVCLTAKDRQKAWLAVGCVAAVFNPVVNLFAIPLTRHTYGNGAIGASVVTVATELIMMIGGILLRPQGVLDRGTISFLARTLLASALMIPAVILLGTAPLLLKVLVAMAAFGVCCALFRLVSWADCRNAAPEIAALLHRHSSIPAVSTGMET